MSTGERHHEPQGLSGKDLELLSGVDDAIARGRELHSWWQKKEKDGSFADRFELARTFNQPDLGTGFFDTAPLSTGPLRVMGVDQEMHFKWPNPNLEKLHANIREYILHYFLRSSDYSPPSAYYETNKLSSVPLLRPFSWCPDTSFAHQGFGYSQLYCKRKDAKPCRIPTSEQYHIIDLRKLQADYDWLVGKVRILDFDLSVQPFGAGTPQLVLPVQENTILVFSPDFVVNRERPAPGVLGEYGLGYSLLESVDPDAVLAYGPGHFAAGFQTIHFRLLQDGTTCVRMVFVVNRPEKILRINFDPVRWSFQVANLMSLGLASRFFWPMQAVLQKLPLQIRDFDPITSFVAVADVLTNGLSKSFCVSLEHLEKYMLVQHFMQHYSMIVSALLTFGQTGDWLNRESVPEWAIEGISL